jgi:hypothetical protein
MVILCDWNWETLQCALEHGNRWSVKAGQLRFKKRHNAISWWTPVRCDAVRRNTSAWKWGCVRVALKRREGACRQTAYLPTKKLRVVTGRWRRRLSSVSYQHHLVSSSPCIALATICLHQHVRTIKCKLSSYMSCCCCCCCCCCLTAICFMSFAICNVRINCFYVF